MRRLRPLTACAAAISCAALFFAVPSASQSAAGAQPADSSDGQPEANRGIQKAIDQLAETIHRYGGKAGVRVVDVQTGQVLGAYNDHEPLNPASNMKLLTAATALSQLTGSYRFVTGLYGERKGAVVEGLVLRGYGDPSLSTQDLWELADHLRRLGIQKVQGDVLVDQGYFDNSYLPPGFEQQPNEWAYFRAPVSAIALNRNTVTMTVIPQEKGQKALISFDPPGVIELSGQVKTGDSQSPESVTLGLSPNGPRLTAKVGGSIPEKSDDVVSLRRIDDPSLYAGYVLKALLAEQGISVSGAVRLGGEKATRALVVHKSAPLSHLLAAMGKDSDNFCAEMVFKSLEGKTKRRGLSSADGATAVERYLKAIGALEQGDVIRNGSGLFDSNRITAATLATALRETYRNPALRPEYVAHLAIGGVDGTLHGRFRNGPAARIVRAKTGTLSSVASLSGYVLAPGDGSPLAFSIVVNEVPGKVTGARAAIDKCVGALVQSLWKGKRGQP